MATHTGLYTIQDFERIASLPENRDHLLELIEGEIVEKMPTEEHGYIVAMFVTFLNIFILERGLGILTTEARHSTGERDVRLPDISFIAGERSPVSKGSVPHMPDLVIEVKSPDDTYAALRKKAEFYLEHGTKLIWLVYPEKRLIEVYRAGADLDFVTADGTLDGGEVLPGFSLPVSKIFPA